MMNLKFYCPYYIELLFDYFGEFKIKTNERYTKDNKDKVLNSILEMLTNKVIFVSEKKKSEFVKWNDSNKIIIERINSMWTENANFSDFYEMVWFGYEDWYINALKKEGYRKEKYSWNDFVKTKIGDLEKWIDENKPKQ